LKRIVVLALFALCMAAPALAQDWPTRTVRIIVPFGAGATPDTIARLIADKLQQKLGQTFFVENKPGASGMTGTDTVAKAEPDGYTIGVSIGGPLAINTLLFSKMPYDPFKDVALITVLTTQPSVLAVPANLGVNSVADLVGLIRKEPKKYNFGSIGNGSLSHLAMEAIAIKSGAQLVHVPYGSSPQAMTAVIRGDVQMVVMPAISVLPHAQQGTVKMLAVTTAKRSPLLPDVPTLTESGIDVEADAWNGLIAPAGTPPAVLAKIQREVSEAINSPELKAKFAAQIMEPVGNSPAQFKAQIDADLARWTPVIKEAGIKVN
jgi:tripartite-type tricarboxylate transporter receptor subunit TctC